jgi:predicted nucleotidyltransferase component of viral defense system
MSKPIKDMTASVKARLAIIAKKEKRSFDSVLLLYMQERMLYRLSISEYCERFILKGGLLMFMLTGYKGRPTKDIDLLAEQISNDIENIKKAFLSICKVQCENDGLVFNGDEIEVEEIKKDAEYHGIRVKTNCFLGNARKVVQLDIGFGDIVVPKPQVMECPILLDMKAPTIKVYSLESIISEKFQAMISLSVSNSRMKDFYDIFTLLNTNSFDGRKLQEAVSETLQRRHTTIEKENIIFSDEFFRDENRIKMWKVFLRKINHPNIEFDEVMRNIIIFLKPIYDAIVYEEEFFATWNYGSKNWI